MWYLSIASIAEKLASKSATRGQGFPYKLRPLLVACPPSAIIYEFSFWIPFNAVSAPYHIDGLNLRYTRISAIGFPAHRLLPDSITHVPSSPSFR